MSAQPVTPCLLARPASAGAARTMARLLLAAAITAVIAVSTAGCAIGQDSAGGPLGSAWPFGASPRAQPETIEEWMAQEKPEP